MISKLLLLSWVPGWVCEEPFKSGVSVSYSLLSLLDISPIVFQSQLFWGSSFQRSSQGLGYLMWDSNASFFKKKLLFLWYFVISLLLVGRYSTGRGPVETASLPLLPYSMWPFYCLLWKSCSAGPLIIFRENYSTGSCNFGVSLGIGETCVFLSPIFNQFPKLLFPLAFLDSQNIPHQVFSGWTYWTF